MIEPRRRSFSDADLRRRLRGSAFYTKRQPPTRHHAQIRRISDTQNIKLSASETLVSPTLKSSGGASKPLTKLAVKSYGSKTGTATARRPIATTMPAEQKQRRSRVLKRQQLQVDRLKRKLKMRQSTALLWSMAGVIFLAGIAVSIIGLRTNHTVQAQVAQLAQKNENGGGNGTTDPEVPSETPPRGNIGDYKVAPELPRFIAIPKFNVKARVLRLGVKANDELKTPSNIYDAGWYEGSAKPGENGAVLIDGHVSGPTTHGVFYNLKNLIAGDMLEVTRGDGQKLQYKVIKLEVYPADKVNMTAAISPIQGQKGLNLITCGGKYIPAKHAFEDRIIVFATQV